MKRVAVCLVAGVLLTMSTAAFAVPVSVTINAGTQTYDNTVPSASITNNTTYPGGDGYITWFQPYSYTAPAAPDLSGMPDGGSTGTLSGPNLDISAVMTIVANSVYNGQVDTVSIRPGSSGAWTSLGNLTTTWDADGDSTSVLTLDPAAADLFAGTSGVNARVYLTQWSTNQGDTVKSSRLQATTVTSYVYTYDDGTEPVIPAPGAILLASMGAGLVSWLRARKVL